MDGGGVVNVAFVGVEEGEHGCDVGRCVILAAGAVGSREFRDGQAILRGEGRCCR